MTITSPESRCVECGMPAIDHMPIRYVFRAWWRHMLLRLVSRPLNNIRDVGADW